MVGPALAILLAGVSGGLCLLALLAWLAGAWRWLTPGAGQLPIAPFTAAFLVLLNAACWVRWQRRADPMVRRLADGTIVCIGVAAGLALLRPWMPGLSSLEAALSAAEPFLAGVPLTLMSPLSGALFVAYGLHGRASRVNRLLAWGLALAVTAFSAWVLVAYAVGKPLFPGAGLVPVALLAAQVFLLSGLAVAWAALCGMGIPPEPPRTGLADFPGRDRSWFFVFILVAVIIMTAGLMHRSVEQGRILLDAHRGFSLIAKVTEAHIQRWRADRLADARRLAENPVFRRDVADWLGDPDRAGAARERLRDRLALEQALQINDRVLLVALSGHVSLEFPSSKEGISRETRRIMTLAQAQSGPVMGDVYSFSRSGLDWLDVAVALRPNSSQPEAVLVLSAAAQRDLIPLLAAGFMLDERTETILMSARGNWILDSKGSVMQPIPAACGFVSGQDQADRARHDHGLYVGMDHHGAMVLAAVQPVAGTDWLVVVKGDIGALLKEARRRTDMVLLVAVLLVFGAAGGTAYAHQRRLAAERARTAKALRESRALYEDLVASQSAGVYRIRVRRTGIWSRPNEPPYVYEFVNDRYCELTGASRDRLLADPSITLKQVHPEDVPGWVVCNEQANRNLEPFVWEGRLLVHGQEQWFHFESRPRLRPDGEVIWTGVLLDIMERKHAEEELRKARDAAQAANRAKSFFLANMSHEIRTPMNAIMGFTDQVLRTQLEPQQRRHLEIVYARCEDLLRLINDILDLSRIEAGRLELEPTRFSPASALAEVAQVFSLTTEQKGLSLTTAVSDTVPAEVVGDARRLRQVLVNLVGNAVKFTDQGGIRLAVDWADPADQAPGAVTLRFEVRDTGVGIPSDQQALIFDPFIQGSHTVGRLAGGTGLGLAIAKRLLEMMAGRLWFESKPGQGTTFFFTVRFQEPPTGQTEEKP
jgi:signal transduction histidine kinase